jgi:proline iminopeptidase
MHKKTGSMQAGYIPVTGGKVWYEAIKMGDGIPLLTLHGGPGMPHNYLEPLARLANERPVVFYDQLGCGKSERPDDLSLWQRSRFVKELDQVRDALNLQQFHLFGHSWGSMLAIDYALTKPNGLVSLILASPALSIPRWLHDTETHKRSLPAKLQEILRKHEQNGSTDAVEYQQATMKFYQRYLCRMQPWPEALNEAAQKEGAIVYETMWGPSEFYMTGNLLDYDMTPRLGEIVIPTLFTCGRYDEATPVTTAYYQSLMPQSEIALFEHSAHMAHLEETDTYIHTVRDFLCKVEQHQP